MLLTFWLAALALLGCAGDGFAERPSRPSCRDAYLAVDSTPTPGPIPEASAAPSQPRVTIIATPKEGPGPLRVQLRAELAGIDGPVSFLWRLGDGTESTEPEPPARVYRVGRYDVVLTVTDPKGRKYKASVTIDSQCKGC